VSYPGTSDVLVADADAIEECFPMMFEWYSMFA